MKAEKTLKVKIDSNVSLLCMMPFSSDQKLELFHLYQLILNAYKP